MRIVPNTSPNIIGGYSGNFIGAGASGSTIGGGGQSGSINGVGGSYATVGGGHGNTASFDAPTVGGGHTNLANGTYATVGGGNGNTASGPKATVGGGFLNTASNNYATVGGGVINTASNNSATVGGGDTNTASNNAATVPGGKFNTASGLYSFAAGFRAKAAGNGNFAWADSSNFDYTIGGTNQFGVRATGGVIFTTSLLANGATNTYCSLAPAGASWACSSDRNLKTNFVDVDGRDVLAKLEDVPIQRWTVKGAEGAPPHMGPMAQDFFAAFGLGDSDKSISTIDLDGVSLAAIKGLHAITKEQEERITVLEARVGVFTAPPPVQAKDKEAAPPALPVTVVRESTSASPLNGWALPGSILVFAASLFAVAARRRR